jgi:hypothetical protein
MQLRNETVEQGKGANDLQQNISDMKERNIINEDNAVNLHTMCAGSQQAINGKVIILNKIISDIRSWAIIKRQKKNS